MTPRFVALISALIFFTIPQVAYAVDVGVLLEPISIFRSDLTAIVITFGLPVIAVAVVMDFRYRVFNPLKRGRNFAVSVLREPLILKVMLKFTRMLRKREIDF